MFKAMNAALRSALRLLCGQAGQIPSSLTDNYDALLSTTLRSYRKKLADNITKGNKFVSFLKEGGRFRKQSGGERVAVPLMHAQNNTADIYSGYGVLDTTPQDGITTAFYPWSQLSTSITISGLEKKQNKGEAKILDLLQSKTMQAEVSLKELLNNCLVSGRIASSSANGQFFAGLGRLDSGAVGPLPLPVLIDSNPARSVSVGNINGATYTFWQNQTFDGSTTGSTATSFVGLRNELNRTYNRCSRGVGGAPDLMVSDQIGWETYWLSLTVNERYIIDNKKTLDILGGSDALKFRGATWFWDEVVPDVETNATVVAIGNSPATGTDTLSTVFFINSASFDFIVESDTDMDTTPFLRPENQDASVAQILWMGQVGVNNRRKNGVLSGISRSITS